MSAAARRYAFESTVEQLATAIRLGVHPVGERLPPERELAEKLGVSRSTLREAFDALRQAGLIRTTRGRAGGTFVVSPAPVAPPVRAPVETAAEEETDAAAPGVLEPAPDLSPGTVRDTLVFRRVVEPGAAALAASVPLSAGQRAALAEALDQACHPPDDAGRRVADSRLHLLLAELSGSALLVDAVTRVHARVRLYLEGIPVLRVNIHHSDVQHRQIVEAVLRGDSERARTIMEEHCDATSALLRGLLA